MCLRSSVSMEMLGSVCKAIRILVLRVCQEFGKDSGPGRAIPALGCSVSRRLSSCALCLHTFPIPSRKVKSCFSRAEGLMAAIGQGGEDNYWWLLM